MVVLLGLVENDAGFSFQCFANAIYPKDTQARNESGSSNKTKANSDSVSDMAAGAGRESPFR